MVQLFMSCTIFSYHRKLRRISYDTKNAPLRMRTRRVEFRKRNCLFFRGIAFISYDIKSTAGRHTYVQGKSLAVIEIIARHCTAYGCRFEIVQNLQVYGYGRLHLLAGIAYDVTVRNCLFCNRSAEDVKVL